jgi:hypothetical protein
LNSKKIHIISTQRSGSTWYQQVLSPYKIHVRSLEFEPFNKNGIKDNFKPPIEQSLKYFHEKEECVIKNQFSRLQEFDENTFNYLTNLPGFERVIFLRIDKFEQTLSHALATQTGEWQNTNLKDPIVIDDDIWEGSKHFISTTSKNLHDFACKHNDKIVWYEDVKTGKNTDRVKNPDKNLFIKNIDELWEDYYLFHIQSVWGKGLSKLQI